MECGQIKNKNAEHISVDHLINNLKNETTATRESSASTEASTVKVYHNIES